MPSAFDPDPFIVILTGAGVLIALVAWLPLALRRLPLSLPIVCIAIMRSLDRRQGRDPDAAGTPPPGLKGPSVESA